jgi:hypothetical protein
MLLILLAIMSSTALLVGAILAASLPHAGFVSYLLAIVVGIALAASNFWMIRRVGLRLAELPQSRSEQSGDRLGQIFCIVVLLWAACAGFVGFWGASASLRLIALK